MSRLQIIQHGSTYASLSVRGWMGRTAGPWTFVSDGAPCPGFVDAVGNYVPISAISMAWKQPEQRR